MIEDIAKAIYTYGPIPILIAIIIYLVTHPEVAEKWGGLFNRLFSKIFNSAERRSVSLDIQGRINSYSKYLNNYVPEILPYGVRIEWVTGNITKESFFRENKVIIKLNYHSNQDENVVRAVLEFITRGLLPDAKPHVDDKVIASVDYICVKKMLEKERRSSIQYYYSEILNPSMTTDNEIKKYVSILNELDLMGYFTSIVLRELQILGLERKFSIPNEKEKEETRNFINFLNDKVVQKPRGINVDPTFIGEYIAVSIVYVARGESIGPHLKWIKQCVIKNIKRIYLCAHGDWNISLVNKLREKLKENKLLVEGFYEILPAPSNSRKKDAICVMYDIKKDNSQKPIRKAVGHT